MSISSDITIALQEKRSTEGEDAITRFNTLCLQALSPEILSFSYYVADHTGEKFNKPRLHDGSWNPHWPLVDGEMQDIPREPEARKNFYLDIKQRTMKDWFNRIESGEFDNHSVATDTKEEEVKDHEDVSNLDMSMPEPVDGGVEIATEKETAPTIDKDEPEKELDKALDKAKKDIAQIRADSLMNIKDLPVTDQVELLLDYNKSVGTPPALKMLSTLKAIHDDKPHPVIRLREAVEELARGVVGPATDDSFEERLAEIESKLEEHDGKIKKLTDFIKSALSKVPEMIKAEILKKFSS